MLGAESMSSEMAFRQEPSQLVEEGGDSDNAAYQTAFCSVFSFVKT